MSVFSQIWAFVVGIFQSQWFKDLLVFLMGRTKDILQQVGEDAVTAIKAEIERVNAVVPEMAGSKKFSTVFKFAVALLPGIPESVINFLIEALVQEVKANPPSIV